MTVEPEYEEIEEIEPQYEEIDGEFVIILANYDHFDIYFEDVDVGQAIDVVHVEHFEDDFDVISDGEEDYGYSSDQEYNSSPQLNDNRIELYDGLNEDFVWLCIERMKHKSSLRLTYDFFHDSKRARHHFLGFLYHFQMYNYSIVDVNPLIHFREFTCLIIDEQLFVCSIFTCLECHLQSINIKCSIFFREECRALSTCDILYILIINDQI